MGHVQAAHGPRKGHTERRHGALSEQARFIESHFPGEVRHIMRIRQLIYVSDLVGDAAQLSTILESSVRHNQTDGLTGMLLYSGGNFLQVLEGPPESVQSTYNRICRDPRHKNCLVLLEQDVPERQFSRWSMGCRQLSAQDAAQFPAHAPYFQYGFRRPQLQAQPGEALEMLNLFCSGML